MIMKDLTHAIAHHTHAENAAVVLFHDAKGRAEEAVRRARQRMQAEVVPYVIGPGLTMAPAR